MHEGLYVVCESQPAEQGPEDVSGDVETAKTGRASVCYDAQPQLHVSSVFIDPDGVIWVIAHVAQVHESAQTVRKWASWTAATVADVGQSILTLHDDGSSGMGTRRRTVARTVDSMVRAST